MTPRPLADRLGIFQGRLVPSATGELQCSPGARWPEEFVSAGALGLSHIELLAERVPDAANPLWAPAGRAALRAAAADAGLRLVSMCVEEPLDVSVSDERFIDGLGARLAGVLRELPLDVVVVPMDGASDLTALPWDPTATMIRALAVRLGEHGARVALETTLPAGHCLRFLDAVASPHVGVCFDVGNATAAGLDPASEISQLASQVWHVHAKDKDDRGANVPFGTGSVNFRAAFDALDDLGYDGAVTIEATRGDDPVATAAAHRSFLIGLERPRTRG